MQTIVSFFGLLIGLGAAMISRRFRILRFWLKGRRNNVSGAEIVKFLFGPTRSIRAKRLIKRVEDEGEDELRLSLHTIPRPVFFPRPHSFDDLYQVICDVLDPNTWHYYEIPYTYVGSEDVVADCGAGEGLFTITVAHRCKWVYAIEPMPRFIKTLKKTFLGIKNITVVPFALGETDGEAFLSDDTINSRIDPSLTEENGYRVVLKPLDALFARCGQRLDYLKADLEGYEVSMMCGAIETIRAYKPRIAITTYHHPDHAQQISTLLKQINPEYQIYVKGIMPQDGRPVMLHAWVD